MEDCLHQWLVSKFPARMSSLNSLKCHVLSSQNILEPSCHPRNPRNPLVIHVKESGSDVISINWSTSNVQLNILQLTKWQ